MIVVRQAEPQDHEAIGVVERSAAATLRRTYRPNENAMANRAQLAHRLGRIVAAIDDFVVGTTQYYEQDEWIRVVGLGVHVDFRGRGAAKALIRYLEEMAVRSKAKGLRLHTVKETGNVEVFERLEFCVWSEEVDFFSESDTYASLTDVEMGKALGE